MDNETPEPPKRRGRKPGSKNTVDSSRLKKIQLDDELKQLIEKKTTPSNLEPLRVKVPKPIKEELSVNVASLNQSANIKIDENAYVKYALELANDHLPEILRRHLEQK